MKIIVLIACVSKKGDKKAKAKDLYISPLFNNSLAYAYSLNPDKIFILSALHHLLDLEKEIEPYNVTLSNVPKKKKWGEKVIEMLANQTDLKQDRFIILAGQEYIKPNRHRLTYYENPLEGVSLFDRIRVLKEMLNSKYF